MGHLLATANPQAAEHINNPPPLPRVGASVVYWPRPGERRAGRLEVPAFVTRRDADNGLLDLVVIYDADDFLSIKNVPRRMGEDRGWEPIGGSDDLALERLEDFKAEMAEVLFSNHDKPNVDFITAMNEYATQIRALQDRVNALELRRGPGRPPNTAKSPDGAGE